MISILAIIVLLFLIVISIIDIKIRAIPSILLTGMLFVVCALNFSNLQYGLLALIGGYLLYEGEFISGIGDVKTIGAIGFMISSFGWFALFMILIFIFGIAMKISINFSNKRFKIRKKDKEVAFIPVLLIVYIVLGSFGGIA